MRLLLLSLVISSSAYATVKPEVPQNPPTSESYASASASSNSNAIVSGVQGGNAHVSANTGDSNANNSIRIEDRLQAPSVSAPSLFASGVCSGGGSIGLSIPGGGISGGRAKEIQGCERREWYRLLRDTSPALALKIACSDPIVAAVAKPGDCDYTPPPAPQPCAVCEPKDGYTKQEVDERIEKAFKSTVAK